MSLSIQRLPLLLVSVRSIDEARDAIAGGCDLLDLKEPSRGSLGQVSLRTMHDVCSLVERLPHAPPMSVAVGELHEWMATKQALRVPGTVSYVKLGLSNAAAAWRSEWSEVRRRVTASTGVMNWVSVHYADRFAGSPPLDDVLTEAIAVGCRGLLIDTFAKGNGRLLDCMTPVQLTEARQRAASAGLLFAIAGSLQLLDLSQLVEVAPDIIAVRSAVCRDGVRTAAVSAEAVQEFRREMSSVFSKGAATSATEAASASIVAI